MMLSNKILLLTGASSGIGSVLLEHFIGRMQQVITSNRKDLSEFLTIEPTPSNLEHLALDLTIEANCQELFHHIKENYGRLDILINCVGGSLFSHPIEEFPADEFDKVISLNLRTPFLLTKHASRLMKSNEAGGNIVHYVSSSAKNISHNKAPYGSAKAGLAHFIHYAASELASYSIKVNGISPTYVFTPRHEREIETKIKNTRQSREAIIERIFVGQLLKKPMYSKDLIEVTQLLATTDVITGQIYNCSLGEVLSY
jgi:NAD(P)-dependent dehydrogenase (short-subunit alcohol dehydrogenase family)